MRESDIAKERNLRLRYCLLVLATLNACLGPHTAGALEQPPDYQFSWGGRGSAPGSLLHPYGSAIGSDGLIYVAQNWGCSVQVFDGDGHFVRSWSTCFWDPAYPPDPSHNSFPVGVAIGQGVVYVADSGTGRIEAFTPNGIHLRGWSTVSPDVGTLKDVAADNDGFIYAAVKSYPESSGVFKYSSDGALATRWIGFGAPAVIAFDPRGYIYVAGGAEQLWKFTTTGQDIVQWSPPNQLLPGGIDVDASGAVYVAAHGSVKKYGAVGQLLTEFGQGQLQLTSGLSIDASGNIYVSEGYNFGGFTSPHRISKYGYAPTPTMHSTWGRLKAIYR